MCIPPNLSAGSLIPSELEIGTVKVRKWLKSLMVRWELNWAWVGLAIFAVIVVVIYIF